MVAVGIAAVGAGYPQGFAPGGDASDAGCPGQQRHRGQGSRWGGEQGASEGAGRGGRGGQAGSDEPQRQCAPAVVVLVAVVEDSDRQCGGVELAGGGVAAGQGVVEHSAPGVVAPEPVHHVRTDGYGAEFFGDGGDDVVGQAMVGGHGVIGVFVAADHPVAQFRDLADRAVPGPTGVDGHGQPVDAGAGGLFGDDGRHLPAGVDPAVLVAVTVEHGAQQLALVLGHGQPEDPCAGGDFAGQGLVAVGHADAAFGGLQIVGQSTDQIVGIDAVGGETQVADDGARRCQQRVSGAAGQRRDAGRATRWQCGSPGWAARGGSVLLRRRRRR